MNLLRFVMSVGLLRLLDAKLEFINTHDPTNLSCLEAIDKRNSSSMIFYPARPSPRQTETQTRSVTTWVTMSERANNNLVGNQASSWLLDSPAQFSQAAQRAAAGLVRFAGWMQHKHPEYNFS